MANKKNEVIQLEAVGNYTKGIKMKKTLIHIVCIFLTILSIAPFYIMIVNATRDSGEIQQSLSFIPGNKLIPNLAGLFERSKGTFNIWLSLWNSFKISACATLLTVYFSSMTAFGFTVYKFKLNNALYTFVLAVMMIPAQVSTVGFIRLMYSFGLMDTHWPMIIPAIAAPATVFFMKQYMTGALPMEIVEAARIDGCSEPAIYNKIVIPVMIPAIATQIIFCFVTNWNNLYMPSLIIKSMEKKTLPLVVQILSSNRYNTDYGMVYCGLLVTIVPMLIVYCFFSKYIIEGVALGSVKE